MNPLTRRVTRLVCATALLAAAASASAQSTARFAPQGDGSEVLDTQTGLMWARCSVGQSWSGGTCAGTARQDFSHEQALQYAAGQAGWRLPNVKELASITDKTRRNTAIDPVAFPATVADWYWTATPVAGYPSFAWYVSFYYGVVDGGYGRNFPAAVRLVRASQ